MVGNDVKVIDGINQNKKGGNKVTRKRSGVKWKVDEAANTVMPSRGAHEN